MYICYLHTLLVHCMDQFGMIWITRYLIYNLGHWLSLITFDRVPPILVYTISIGPLITCERNWVAPSIGRGKELEDASCCLGQQELLVDAYLISSFHCFEMLQILLDSGFDEFFLCGGSSSENLSYPISSIILDDQQQMIYSDYFQWFITLYDHSSPAL